MILSSGQMVDACDISGDTARQERDPMEETQTLDEMERLLIEKAIRTCEGNLSQVAIQLGISRQTLYNKIKRYGL